MITRDTVKKIAHLARLNVSDSEEAALATQLSQILELAETLQKLPVGDIKPTAHAISVSNVFRENGAAKISTVGIDVLKQAPQTKDGFFLVPKVLS